MTKHCTDDDAAGIIAGGQRISLPKREAFRLLLVTDGNPNRQVLEKWTANFCKI
jgi:hypothetical protein